jgi:hypothetical protein
MAAFRNVTTRSVSADGTYRIDELRAGPYHVRAFLADAREATRRMLTIVRGDVERPPPDVTLQSGEVRQHDLQLCVYPTGRVVGHVRCNGVPAHGYSVRIAAGSMRAQSEYFLNPGFQLQRTVEADGSFAFAQVEAGDHDLRVIGPGRGDLVRQPVLVQADATTTVELDLAIGSVAGEVVAPEADAAAPSGTLRLFRDAAAVPENVEEWELSGRLVHARFRDGRFRIEELVAGSYCVEIRAGRDRTVAVDRIDVPAGPPTSARLTIGPRKKPEKDKDR